MSDPNSVLTHAGTAVNAKHLAAAFFDSIVRRYVGTRLGRQELDGEIIEIGRAHV